MSRAKPKPAPPDLYYNVLCTAGCGNKLHRIKSHVMSSHSSHVKHPSVVETTGNHNPVNENEILGGICDACTALLDLLGLDRDRPLLTAAGDLRDAGRAHLKEAEAAARLGARGDEVLAILKGER